jgi:SnoaL-like domain
MTPSPTLPLSPPDQPVQREAAARVVAFFETLTPAGLGRLHTIYTPDAYFRDPFNEVRGVNAVRGIFAHMYVALDKPRFIVTDSVVDGGQCFLTWDFEFCFKGFDKTTLQTIKGTSHLKFNADGLVEFHRDYWDAAEELYEKLPWVGGLMRWLKKRARS